MKKAFTLLELVFVIVVIGILAATIIPKTSANPVQEAAIDLLSKIRYTQHLGMVNDKFDAGNSTWMRDRWQIAFDSTGGEYSIMSGTTYAVLPGNRANNIENISLKDKYQVTVAFTNASGTGDGKCQGFTNIAFDHLGRPIVGDINTNTTAYSDVTLMIETCIITLTNGTNDVVINLEPETGYARIINL